MNETETLTGDQLADAAAALAILRQLGAKVSLALLAERFARAREKKLAELRRKRRPPGTEPAFLPAGRAEKLLRAAESAPGRPEEARGPVLALAMLCGLRAREIAALKWEEIDLADGTLRVGGSDGMRMRVVVMEESARAWLVWWRERLAEQRGGRLPAGSVAPRSLEPFGSWAAPFCEGPAAPGTEKRLTTAGVLALLRGTYAAMHLAARRDAKATAANLGWPRGADALAFHYEGLVSRELASGFWQIVPLRRTGGEAEDAPAGLERPALAEARRKAAAMKRREALRKWKEERAAREKRQLKKGLPSLTAEQVRRVFEVASKHPGRVAGGIGLRLALGFFAGFKTAEVHAARWEDVDLKAGTIRRRPLYVSDKAAWKRKMAGVPKMSQLHPAAVAWIALWKRWTIENGGKASGPLVPRRTSFHFWQMKWLAPEGLKLTAAKPGELPANTYLAMRYPDLYEPHPLDPLAGGGAGRAEAETFWSLAPAPDLRLPRVRFAVVKKPRLDENGNPIPAKRGRPKKTTEGMKVHVMRRFFLAALEEPGSREAAAGATMTLGFLCGLHTSEIERARWEDVEWATGILRVPKPDGHRDEAENLEVPLHPVAKKWLMLWYRWAFKDGLPPEGAVVPQPWRFVDWRRSLHRRSLRKVEWPYDVMRITHNARKHWKSFWNVEPDRDPSPPEILPGRGWRKVRRLEEQLKRAKAELELEKENGNIGTCDSTGDPALAGPGAGVGGGDPAGDPVGAVGLAGSEGGRGPCPTGTDGGDGGGDRVGLGKPEAPAAVPRETGGAEVGGGGDDAGAGSPPAGP